MQTPSPKTESSAFTSKAHSLTQGSATLAPTNRNTSPKPPPEAARQLLDAGDGLVKLVTLAPEQDPGGETTKFLANQGVRVAAGTLQPFLDELSIVIDAGLTMVTHFGNGCPVDLPRHDNVLQRFLHFRKDLYFSFIPDGAHVPFFALRNYIDQIGIDRITMTTDAISAAGLGSGLHELSGITVEVDAKGVARRPAPYLAGSTLTLPKMLGCLREGLGLSNEDCRKVLDGNPRNSGSHKSENNGVTLPSFLPLLG